MKTKVNQNFTLTMLVLAFIFYKSIFIVNEDKIALVVQFGKIQKEEKTPGLKLKIPFIQDVKIMDKKIIQVDSPAMEIVSIDQKRIIIDSYTKYKIVNFKQFYKTLYNKDFANKKITSVLDSSIRQVVASKKLTDLLTDQRQNIMSMIKSTLAKQVKSYGIEIVDVRIIRGDLPNENSKSVFNRMITEREKEAKELRAEGREQYEIIKSEADRQFTETISSAEKQKQEIIGMAESKANAMYNQSSYASDPVFLEFIKTTNAYNTIFGPKNKKTLIISTDNRFFKKLNNY